MPYSLRSAFPDKWVRFHSLPESKRYPDSEREYGIVLDRYNAVLDELFAGQEIYVITPDWSEEAERGPRPAADLRLHPDARYWTSTVRDPDDEPTYTHLYLYCPYDGGADVLLPTFERDALRLRHSEWLSVHRAGL